MSARLPSAGAHHTRLACSGQQVAALSGIPVIPGAWSCSGSVPHSAGAARLPKRSGHAAGGAFLPGRRRSWRATFQGPEVFANILAAAGGVRHARTRNQGALIIAGRMPAYAGLLEQPEVKRALGDASCRPQRVRNRLSSDKFDSRYLSFQPGEAHRASARRKDEEVLGLLLSSRRDRSQLGCSGADLPAWGSRPWW
jgi:hypothetical protein